MPVYDPNAAPDPTAAARFGDLWNTPPENFSFGPNATGRVDWDPTTVYAGDLTYANPDDYRLGDWRAQLAGLPNPSGAALDAVNRDVTGGLLAPTALDPFFGPAPSAEQLNYNNSDQANQTYNFPDNWQSSPTFHSAMNVSQQQNLARDLMNAGDTRSGLAAFATRRPETFGSGLLANFIGANLPSTNDWRALPPPYNRPGHIMRNGRIIDTNSLSFRLGLPWDASKYMTDIEATSNRRDILTGGGSFGYPLSIGLGNIAYWPGDVSGSYATPEPHTSMGAST